MKLLRKAVRHFRVLHKFARKMKELRNKSKYHKWFLDNQKLSLNELGQQSRVNFAYKPLISIVVPVYNPSLVFLQEMLDSVLNQSYSNWELCIADGGSNDDIRKLLLNYMKKDMRIKISFLTENLHICGNSNEALSLASGDYIGLLDHDDLLAPQCLFEYVKAINLNDGVGLLYCDEDFYSNKKHLLAHIKPDFALDSLHETNYITHFIVFKSSLLSNIDLPVFNPEFQGAQDYDLVLRLIETVKSIVHIPQILYHWRMHKHSTLGNPDSKKYAYENGKRALESHFYRTGHSASVAFRPNVIGIYKVSYELKLRPLVSILIPNKNQLQMLQNCIQSLLQKTNYDNFEITIIENNSDDNELFNYYKKIMNEKIKVIYYPDNGFNYAKINNFGVRYVSGEFVVFLNNDTSILNPDWLIEMLQYAQFSRVGAVGAKLLFSDKTVQHGGVVIGKDSLPGNLFDSYSYSEISKFARTHRVQNLSAVTAACLMVEKYKFIQVGGFDEKLAVAFNDVDFCLRLLQAGYNNVFNPDAVLYHYESRSRGYENNPAKKHRFNDEYNYFRSKWGDHYRDKYYSHVYDNYDYTWK